MKLALIGPLPPLRGGISSYNHSLLQSLQSHEHDILPISFLTLYPSFMFPGTSQFDDHTHSPANVSRELVAWNPLTWRKTVASIRRFGATHIILEHWHPFFVPCLRFIAKNSMCSNVTIIAHNVLPHEKSGVGSKLNPMLFNLATKVIVGTGEQLDQLHHLLPNANGTVVPHPAYTSICRGSKVSSFRDQHVQARKDLGISLDTPYFVHLGLVRKYKGVDILLQAVSELQFDFKLDIIGEFYDKPGEYLALHNELQLSDRVSIEDRFLSNEEMEQRILAADAIVLPYRHATQSGIAMAALAGGAPVIGTSTGALRDIIEEGENGCLAQPESVDSFTESIHRFMKPGLKVWRAKRDSIATDTINKYSWEALVNKVLEDR
jgi:glycosyltransferase involved in cell wall biosynthesis